MLTQSRDRASTTQLKTELAIRFFLSKSLLVGFVPDENVLYLMPKKKTITAVAEHTPLTNRRIKLFKTLRTLAFVGLALLLSVPSIALEVQSDGLTENSKVFIDSHFEFTEIDQAPLTLDIIENTVTAVTLAQNRTMDSANDNITQIVSTFNSVAKLPQSCKFEVGWQRNLNLYN